MNRPARDPLTPRAIRRLAVMTLLTVPICTGCASATRSVADAFPPAGAASPWILKDRAWAGPFEDAAPALGRDAETWRRFAPTRVWLAVYANERDARRTVTARGFAFASLDDAHRAFEAFRPEGAKPYDIGDAGCWTEIGVLFRWGRLVFDVFGDTPSWDGQVQASLITAFIGKRMPAGVPDDPR